MGWNHNFISGRKWDFSLHTSRPAVQAYAVGYPMGISGIVTIYLYLLLQSICEQHLQLAHTFLKYGTSTLLIQFLRAEIIPSIHILPNIGILLGLCWQKNFMIWFTGIYFSKVCHQFQVTFSLFITHLSALKLQSANFYVRDLLLFFSIPVFSSINTSIVNTVAVSSSQVKCTEIWDARTVVQL